MKEMYRYRTGMEGKSLENRKEDTEDKDITQTGKHRNSHTLNKQDHDIFSKSSHSSNLKVGISAHPCTNIDSERGKN